MELRLGHTDDEISVAPKSTMPGPQDGVGWKQDDALRVDETIQRRRWPRKAARGIPPVRPDNAYVLFFLTYTSNHKTRCAISQRSSWLSFCRLGK